MLDEEKIAPHVEDIKRVLGDSVERDLIEAELRKYLEEFMVPLGEAKRSVVKKYDGDPAQLPAGESRMLGELKGDESSVELLVRLITVNRSEGTGRDGRPQTRFWGLLTDGEVTMPYTAWNDFSLRRGEVLRIHNAYSRLSPKGDVQVNLGDRASVARMPEDAVPPAPPREGAQEGEDDPGRWTRGVGMTPVSSLRDGMSGVEVKARILTVRERTVGTRDGEKTVWSGVMADGSGMADFSSWHDHSLKPGMAVSVASGYVKDWRGSPQFTFDERSTVRPLPDDELPPASSLASVPVTDLREGMNFVSVTARILHMTERTVDARGETKTVYSGELADTSGTVQFSAWHDFGLEPGSVVRVTGGYVRSYRGPQLTFDERATVERLSDDALPPEKELAEPAFREIAALIDAGGGSNVAVRGVVLDIRESSGLVMRCDQDGCNRVLQNGACMVHGGTEGRPDLRIKGVIDDGTGAISVVLGREATEELLGKDLDACVAGARDRMGTGFVRDELVERLVARPLMVEGNVVSDDFGVQMIGRKARVLQVDVKLEAQKLLEEMGV